MTAKVRVEEHEKRLVVVCAEDGFAEWTMVVDRDVAFLECRHCGGKVRLSAVLATVRKE